jgi:hypothetical protein
MAASELPGLNHIPLDVVVFYPHYHASLLELR